ncbi:hypothetical protein KSP40_PGU006046 [Platanthera guangdongensis]|uniref:Uncharacterized protein n=1 Tax=Platanthera guangdongensis TaxID=2320717 RepID=A0ABR2N0L6_9ASPA
MGDIVGSRFDPSQSPLIGRLPAIRCVGFLTDVKAQLDSGSLHLLTDSMEWPGAAYSFPFGPDDEEDLAGEPGLLPRAGTRAPLLTKLQCHHPLPPVKP